MAKMPPYRLQALFDIREKAKKEAEEAYARVQVELRAEEQKLEDLKDELKDMIQTREDRKQEYSQKMSMGELTVIQIQVNDRHIERMKSAEKAFGMKLVRQKEAIDEKYSEVEEAKEKMLEATQEFKALEKHKENWVKEVKKEWARKEEEEVEDISQAQYYARMKIEAEEQLNRDN
ncbi:MAG: hypothetical protein GY822_10165 [Deltaproteobacteria bacterium]|nr:hypothetical protein [Deltaproteobacteria bacterium]